MQGVCMPFQDRLLFNIAEAFKTGVPGAYPQVLIISRYLTATYGLAREPKRTNLCGKHSTHMRMAGQRSGPVQEALPRNLTQAAARNAAMSWSASLAVWATSNSASSLRPHPSWSHRMRVGMPVTRREGSVLKGWL